MATKGERMEMESYTVEGSGRFPIDMLRYDSAWPASEIDSSIIEVEHGKRQVALYRVKRPGARGPCEPRWESFNWRVVLTRNPA